MKMRFFSIVFLCLLFLVGCSVNDANLNGETNNDKNDNEQNEQNEENETNDNEEEQVDVLVYDVDKVLYDQEKVDLNHEPIIIEYNDKFFVHANTALKAIDYSLSYNSDEQIFTVDEGYEEYHHEVQSEDESLFEIAVSEIELLYVEDLVKQDLFNQFHFLEYEDDLYIPANIARRMFRESFTFVADDKRLEIGRRSSPVYIDELDFTGAFGIVEGGFTRDEDITTVKDETYEAIAYTKNTPLFELTTLSAQYAYTELNGFLYNESEYDLLFEVETTDKGEVVDVVVEPDEVYEFELDIKGEKRVTFLIDSDKEAITQPGADFRIYLEAY